MKLKNLLEGFAWERQSGKPLPTLNDVAKKYNESNDKTVNEVVYRPLKSNIVAKWTSSDVAQKDLETYLQMIYEDGNYNTMDDMGAMFNVLSKLSKAYLRKMQ